MMRVMRVVVVTMMVSVMRRVRKAGTRKQTQRNHDSDELGHIFDPNLRDSEFPMGLSITLRGARRESSCPAERRSMRVFRATHGN
jgi:hypothetical protein